MTRWDATDLDLLGRAQEIQISTRRTDGTWTAGTPIWIVRVHDDLFVRSHRGRRGAWYRRVVRGGTARIHVGHRELTVEATEVHGPDQAAIDAAYRDKYARYGSSYVTPMTAPAAQSTTLRLTPSTVP